MLTNYTVSAEVKAVCLTFENRLEVYQWLSDLVKVFFTYTAEETYLQFYDEYGHTHKVPENSYIIKNNNTLESSYNNKRYRHLNFQKKSIL